MSQSPVGSDASHESGDDQANSSKQHALKDKQCPYCKTNFTSSSLGRHLDQFITKKRPDGIHDVTEIRKLRAGITRRTARGGKKGDAAGSGDGRNDNEEHAPGEVPAQPATSFLDSLSKAPPGANDVQLNRMNWQATGVLPDNAAATGALPGVTRSPSAPSVSTPTGLLAQAGQKRSYSTYANDLNPSNVADNARALELSLREVLDTIRAATKRSNPSPAPFTFDFQSQTFPGLCLALLPVPATIFKSSPFATPATIPLAPPGPDQHHALQQEVPAVIDRWKWTALSHTQRNPIPGGNSVGEEAEHLSRLAQNHISQSLTHVDAAFHHYMSYSPEQRQALWNIELLRALKTEQDKVTSLNDKVERMLQESNQLQQQIDYISRCQWPREMALWPPERVSFDNTMQNELRGVSMSTSHQDGSLVSPRFGALPSQAVELPDTTIRGTDKWDFDKLVNKWKRHVREDRARKAAQPSSTSMPSSDHGMADSAQTNVPGAANFRRSTLGPEPSVSSTNHLASSGRSTAQNSPLVNGHRPNGVYDPARSVSVTSGGQGGRQPQAGTSMPSAPTISVPPTPHSGNVQIISDVHDHMARFAPWFQQQREKELAEKRLAAQDDD